MSMFRRPTDDSSSSSSSGFDNEELSEDSLHSHQNGSHEAVLGADLTATETLSSGESLSIDESRADDVDATNVDHHRNMMLASLLEDFYKTRAAELLNAAQPGLHLHRQSPEVQPIARNLFVQATQALTAGGVLPSSVATDVHQHRRTQYLRGFDNLGLQNLQENDLLSDSLQRRLSATTADPLAVVKNNSRPLVTNVDMLRAPMHELALRTGSMSLMSYPSSDMRLAIPQQPRSHYRSSFKEMQLLGKGGFGRVYHTYNVFDKNDYAVKKIPLSPKLSQRYRERGHAELASILREVQALARLDHCNVVRYHATWIEEPDVAGSTLAGAPELPRPQNSRKLLTHQPAVAFHRRKNETPSVIDLSNSPPQVLFEADSVIQEGTQKLGPDWSVQPESSRFEPSSIPDSGLFTDGMSMNVPQDKVVDDPFCYVLHVQMSMYPMTLAQYLAPVRREPTINSTKSRRHCFHVLPAFRILLGILCGIQYIHAKGLIHRDIKPSNIFLSCQTSLDQPLVPDGYHDISGCPSCPPQSSFYVNPRIGDFGLVADLAREVADSAGNSGTSPDKIVGTEYYRPPQHTNSKGKSTRQVDEKTDVFALGVILVELLWNFATSMERLETLKRIQQGRLPDCLIETLEGELPDSGTSHLIEECILGMIHNDVNERWSCDRVKDHIDLVLRNCTENRAQQQQRPLDGGAEGLHRGNELGPATISKHI